MLSDYSYDQPPMSSPSELPQEVYVGELPHNDEPTDLLPPPKKKSIATIATVPPRLPSPCPVPMVFSHRVMEAIANDCVEGNIKLALIREASAFYYGLCPIPSGQEYDIMARTLCEKYPKLKNKQSVKGSDWVSYCYYIVDDAKI